MHRIPTTVKCMITSFLDLRASASIRQCSREWKSASEKPEGMSMPRCTVDSKNINHVMKWRPKSIYIRDRIDFKNHDMKSVIHVSSGCVNDLTSFPNLTSVELSYSITSLTHQLQRLPSTIQEIKVNCCLGDTAWKSLVNTTNLHLIQTVRMNNTKFTIPGVKYTVNTSYDCLDSMNMENINTIYITAEMKYHDIIRRNLSKLERVPNIQIQIHQSEWVPDFPLQSKILGLSTYNVDPKALQHMTQLQSLSFGYGPAHWRIHCANAIFPFWPHVLYIWINGRTHLDQMLHFLHDNVKPINHSPRFLSIRCDKPYLIRALDFDKNDVINYMQKNGLESTFGI